MEQEQRTNTLGKIRKVTLIVAGSFFVAIGTLGIFLPLLPTTIFLLLAAYCYARSSDKFYNWLLKNPLFGKYLSNYRDKKGISVKTKIFTLSLLWLSILYSTIVAVNDIWIRAILLIIAAGVTIHILTIKTFREEEIRKAGLASPVAKTKEEKTGATG